MSTTTLTAATYEVNAKGNRSFRSPSAAKVAGVAAEWAKQGHEPQAYAILDGHGDTAVRCEQVPVTTAKATKAALLAAA